MIINIFIFLCITLFSCEKANKETTKTKADTQNQIGVTDSIFRFNDGIISILEDSKGAFWIGSKENGLCKYNGKTYTYFTTKDGLPNTSIPYIQEDELQNIWLDNGKKITRFDGNEFRVFDKKYIPTIDINKSPIIVSKSDLWFRDYSKVGVYRYDGNDLSFISFENPPLNLTANNSHFFVSGITDIVDSQIWFGTLMQGAVGFNGKEFDKIVDQSLNFDSDKEFLHIRSMLLDSKGNLWIGNNGIGVILKKGDSLIHFSKEQGKLIPMNEFEANTNKKQFANNKGLQSVFAIEEDNEGNIWFGDRDSGAWKYDGRNLYNYKSIYHKEDMSELIWDIYSDRNGNLYFILVNGEVFTFNGNSFERFEGF
ncbi:two-component regulator propeller domain-containing protein [Ascidiimonas sp. W6]|uniref:two-component regulator propeller domain-containing protein n=1 Tax=Ascidiimonas meishanensis TaxID=3128903 RepID=UPI0030ECC2BF